MQAGYTATTALPPQGMPLPDNNIRIGHLHNFRIYNVACHGFDDFAQLRLLALKLQAINTHFDPNAEREPVVFLKNGQSPLFIDRDSIEEEHALTEDDRALMKNVKCGVYAEGYNEKGEPYFAYFYLPADLLQNFLNHQAREILNLRDYYAAPRKHGAGTPDEDTIRQMAKLCFVGGIMQIFGFTQEVTKW